jgi:hypothetical protein
MPTVRETAQYVSKNLAWARMPMRHVIKSTTSLLSGHKIGRPNKNQDGCRSYAYYFFSQGRGKNMASQFYASA